MQPALAWCLAVVTLQGTAPTPPVLEVGKDIEGRIDETDPVVRTATIDMTFTNGSVHGKTIAIRVAETGTYTIELRSYLIDAYLVLRDDSGMVLAEDDDGLGGVHPRIVVELSAASRTSIQA